MSKVTRWFALSLVCAAVVGVAATAATARTTATPSATTGSTAPLRSALYDSLFLSSEQQSTAFAMASQAGATYARLDTTWKLIAPQTLPSSGWTLADQANPNSPYYRWDKLDATVAAAEAHGIQPILDILGTPKWAYHVQPGTVSGGQPDIDALGAFAKALALRYDGSGPAPAVRTFSVYNEVNFNRNFSPQDPTYYRSMVNAVADSVHAVDPSNLALAGELAPYKHASTNTDKNNVIPPITWMQKMFCLSSTMPYHRTCNTQTHFDVWTHHPYSDRGPFGHASASGGVELGDLPKMDSLLRAAWQLGAITTASGHAPQFWVTEIGWSSNLPNKHGVPLGLLTRWVSESYYQVWKSGATLGTWFLLQDKPQTTPFQSGLYRLSDSLSSAVAKPLLQPFEFPFVAYLKSAGRVKIWGRDPHSDMQDVAIQHKTGNGWQTVATITSNNYGIFQATVSIQAMASWGLRASAGGTNSAMFSLKVPSNENMIVVPFPRN